MTKHMTTHAPIQDGGIISQWTIISGGPSSPVVRTGPARPGKGEPKPIPERNVLVTLRQLLPADKESGRREMVEARVVFTPAILRALIDQLEDHASNVEPAPGETVRAGEPIGHNGNTRGGTIPGGIEIHVDPNPTLNVNPAEIARARAAVARLNGVAL